MLCRTRSLSLLQPTGKKYFTNGSFLPVGGQRVLCLLLCIYDLYKMFCSVGFRNYKFFLLCLLYANICLISSTWFMGATFVQEWNNPQVPGSLHCMVSLRKTVVAHLAVQIQWGILYFNFMGAFLGGYMSIIVLPFFFFHLWLTSKVRTFTFR